MTTKILHKRSSTSGSIPATSSLDTGELAINVADAKIYIKQNDGVVETIRSPLTMDVQNLGDVLVTGKQKMSGSLNLTSANIELTGSLISGVFNATELVYPTLSTTLYAGANIDYTAQRTSGIRTGTIMTSWSGSNISYTDISNSDVGDTEDLSFNLIRFDDQIQLRVYSQGLGSGEWTIHFLFKLFPNLM
jgi:hypothetical protein